MGRGNVCVRGEYETLFYVDYDYFEQYKLDENDEPTTERDYECESMDIQIAIDELKILLQKRTNFIICDRWHHRDTHVILENKIFEIAIEDNQWSFAVMLLQKEDVDISLHKIHFERYKNILRDVLFEQYPKLGVYGGAWTSGTINREDYVQSPA